MATREDYERWLASVPESRIVVETVQITHPAVGSSALGLLFVNGLDGFSASLETGQKVDFLPSRFDYELPRTEDSTNTSASILVSALDGLWYSALRQMTDDDRAVEMTLFYRLYFLDDPSSPLIVPVPRWTVQGLQLTRFTLRADLRPEPLRVRRVGIYYTTREFPILAQA